MVYEDIFWLWSLQVSDHKSFLWFISYEHKFLWYFISFIIALNAKQYFLLPV